MKVDYEESEKRVLEHEGGYTNDAEDSGGPTNWGITIFDARLYWKSNATIEDVKRMPLSVAQDIYRDKYWAALNCDDLPAGVDYCVFDYGVNSGVAKSGKVLRKLFKMSTTDWKVSPDVLTVVSRVDANKLIDDICDERMAFLKSLHNWSTYSHGWSVRVAEVRLAAKQMAKRQGTPPPVSTHPVVAQDDLAARVAKAYGRAGYNLDYGKDVVNPFYIEGMDLDGRPNDNRPNVFNDLRGLLVVAEGQAPKIVGLWEATTEPGRYWTQHPMNEGGAAHIALGQQTAWEMGTYHDAPALVEVSPIKFTRDPNKIYKRYGKVYFESIGVHHHAGYNYPHDDLGRSSAGCQVGRTTAGHAEFIKLCKGDARYVKDHKFKFTSTVFSAGEVLSLAPAPQPAPKPAPPPTPEPPTDVHADTNTDKGLGGPPVGPVGALTSIITWLFSAKVEYALAAGAAAILVTLVAYYAYKHWKK